MAITWLNKEELPAAVQKRLGSADKVLDIGCGIRPQSLIEPKIHICAEPFSEYVEILQNRYAGNPRYVILHGTADHILSLLPDHSIDTIFLVDVIEHLEKELGRTIIKECERVARKQIVLFTPIGFMHQESSPDGTDGWGLHGEEWQDHKSGWTPEEFGGTWHVLACDSFHEYNAVGEKFNPPIGAFWAIKNLESQGDFPKFDEKLIVFSHILPPSPSGQATVLYRLLKGIGADSYCLVSSTDYDDPTFLQTSLHRLQAKYRSLGRGLQIRNFSNPVADRGSFLGNILLKLVHDSIRLIKVMKDEEGRSILVCTGDACDIPVAYLASRLRGAPLYLYYFDYYSEQWAATPYYRFAKIVESIVVKGARGIIVPNEKMADELKERYGADSTIIHNPVGEDCLASKGQYDWPLNSDGIRIVYTGSIYRAQADAFRTLLNALEEPSLRDARVTLHLYTAQTREELEQQSIVGPYELHPHASHSVIEEVQRKADILYLPLSFEPEISKVIDTSSPGKMGEYLASGRPVLVHAPPSSFIKDFFSQTGCGIVVDQNKTNSIVSGIRQLISNEKLRNTIVDRALARAKADFSPITGRNVLVALINEKI